MLGWKKRWMQSWKGYPIQHNSYPRLAVVCKPQLESKAAGALRCNTAPGDIELVSWIFEPQKSNKDMECECLYVNCLCLLPPLPHSHRTGN